MMRLAPVALPALIPSAALAGFERSIDRQCGGGTCEPFAGDPFLIRETGEARQISRQGQAWEGCQTSTIDPGGEVSIVIPPQNGVSGPVSIFPGGEILFTAHAPGDSAVAITGSGNCMADGGRAMTHKPKEPGVTRWIF